MRTNCKNRLGQPMKEFAFAFVLGIDGGCFVRPTFEKMKIHHSENEEEK